MAQFAYNFTKFPNNVIRPLVNVRIINPVTNQSIQTKCLVDTGADKCVFPENFATILGHDLKNNGCVIENSKGVGGIDVPTWLHTYKIELFTEDFKTRIWKSDSIQIGCLEHNNIFPLLGYIGFLEHMNIRLNYPTKKIVIEI